MPPKRQVWMAKEYHDTDFRYADLAEEESAYLARVASLPRAREVPPPPALQRAWDAFYVTHAHKFFHPRYYTLRLFPELASCRRVLEVGCGNGSNVLPLLDKTDIDTCVGVDVSSISLSALAASEGAQRHATRLQLLQWDVTTAPLPEPLRLHPVDAAVCMFALSALPPESHLPALRNVRDALLSDSSRLLCFRDYAWRDLAQLRAPPSAVLTPSLHARADGTLAYYFTQEELCGLLEAAGFSVLEVRYACVENVNRSKGVSMKRVFLHAKAVAREI